MLDFDLAEMYGIETRVLKQSVRRNLYRFPTDFMFELTKLEYDSLRSQFVTLKNDGDSARGKHSKYQSFAFTEQGVAMLSSILNSKIAIEVNIRIIRAFVAIRKSIAEIKSSKTIEDRIKILEKANEELLEDINDLSEDTRKNFDDLFDAFAKLANEINLNKNKPPRKPIGFAFPEKSKTD